MSASPGSEHDGRLPRRHGRARALGLALLSFATASARDAYVVLSGGGTPLSNNYSQYLQAKEMSAYLRRTRPADSVWVFFGAGNRPGEPAALADVHRRVKEGGLLRDMWLPGVLPRNRAATKEEFLRALGSEILPGVHGGGTLYLFVGDHGSQSNTEPKESVITMWQMVYRNAGRGWVSDPSEVLRVSELREALAAGLGRGKVVFCMTQCYSGGFHYLGVPRDVTPDPSWFQVVPDWANAQGEAPLPMVAGFTSADEDSIAAGCDPDPDPDRWAGYDRFAPEALIGIDLESGARTGDGQPSLAAAHKAAVMLDQTIDRPRSSSEQYLERWAQMIERLGAEPMLTAAAREQVASYRRTVDGGLPTAAADPGFAARRDLYTRYVSRMCGQNPSAAELLRGGSYSDLKRASGMSSRSRHGGGRQGPRLWTQVLRPAWKRAVEAGQIGGLAGEALAFERYLLEEEDKGRELMSRSDSKDLMLNELYWRSGYAFPSRLDERKAEAVTRWGAQRRGRIIEWGRGTTDPALRDAADTLAADWLGNRLALGGRARTLPREIAAARTLFYRRVLAAWAFLLDMNEQEALSRLHQYIELEQAPLPPASAYRG